MCDSYTDGFLHGWNVVEYDRNYIYIYVYMIRRIKVKEEVVVKKKKNWK